MNSVVNDRRAASEKFLPWKDFLDQGVRIAFGTGYPVEPLTPFRGLYAAVTRKNEAGNKEFFPEQKLTIPAGAGGLYRWLRPTRSSRKSRKDSSRQVCWPIS